jgi:hypothetical protein
VEMAEGLLIFVAVFAGRLGQEAAGTQRPEYGHRGGHVGPRSSGQGAVAREPLDGAQVT